ncbi:MAG TPA: divergent polysaccharide deacetylase family protein [Terriglobia bacterium]|nr:divergent polysaccharide deacetylase family protein [Terriglobia bacterium]
MARQFFSPGRRRTSNNRRARARRRRSPSRRQALLAFFGASILIVLCVAGACKWLRPKTTARKSSKSTPAKSTAKTLTDAERREIAAHVSSAIERAGGDDVWIKPDHGAVPDPEVLAVSRAFDVVAAAIRQQAEKDGLRTATASAPGGNGSRSLEVTLSLSPGASGVVGRWRLREVPRLYRAAIVIDDLGQEIEPARRIFAMPYALTLSVLPGLPHSSETAEDAHRAHREVMLHLPMEAQPGSGPPPGRGEIKVGMPAGEVAETIERDLASVPYASGVNNHEGSRATADAPLMAEVMRTLGGRGLYFIDSRTSPSTVALAAARRQGLPTFYRSVFLDDTETVAYTLGQLHQFRRVVEYQGVALAIGHPHPTTLRALERFLPALEQDNIELVPASELVRLPEAARLSPPGDKRE